MTFKNFLQFAISSALCAFGGFLAIGWLSLSADGYKDSYVLFFSALVFLVPGLLLMKKAFSNYKISQNTVKKEILIKVDSNQKAFKNVTKATQYFKKDRNI